MQGTPDENKATMQGSPAYGGTQSCITLVRADALKRAAQRDVSAQANAHPANSTDPNSGPAIALHRGPGVDAVLEAVTLESMALRAGWHSRRVRCRRSG